MNYLEKVLTATSSTEPTQFILYFFDKINVNYLKEKIQNETFNELQTKINVNTEDVFELMVIVYKKEILHNIITDIKQTIKKVNNEVIKLGVESSKSSITMSKYRDTYYTTRMCDLPECTTNDKKLGFN